MDPELEIKTEAAPAEAEQATTPVVTDDGSASSAEATDDTRSTAEQVRDEWLKTYGEPEAPEAPKEEPKAEEQPVERQEGDDDAKAPRLTKEEFDALPPKAKERIGYVSRIAKEAKAEVERVSAQLETYREGHEAREALRTYAEQNNLAADDVTTGLAIMAQFANGKHEDFLREIMPFVEIAQRATGKAISPEIQQLVDAGEITPEAAKRMTQAEEAAAIAAAHAARVTKTTAAERQAQQRQSHVAALQQSVRDTEAALRLSDPDYALKAAAIQAQFKGMLQRGAIPKDAADAAAMIREIHANVVIAKPAQPLRPTAPRPAASEPAGMSAAPKTVAEAVRMAAESYHAGR